MRLSPVAAIMVSAFTFSALMYISSLRDASRTTESTPVPDHGPERSYNRLPQGDRSPTFSLHANVNTRETRRLPGSPFNLSLDAYNKFYGMDEAMVKDWLSAANLALDEPKKLSEVSAAIARLAENDPEYALRVVQSLGSFDDLPWINTWIDQIFGAWAIIDAEQALRSARTLPLEQRIRAGQSILFSSRRENPMREHIEKVLNVSISPWSRIVDGEADIDVHSSYWKSAIKNSATENELWDIAARWAEVDPASSVAAVMALKELRHWTSRSGIGTKIAAMWAGRDPDSARNWALSLPESEFRSNAISSIYYSLAEMNPKDWLDSASAISDKTTRLTAVSAVLGSWASHDIDGALSAFESMSDPEMRMESVYSIAHRLALSDATAAFYWASTLSLEESGRVIPSIVGQQAMSDPESAALWVARIEDRETQRDSAMYLATQWASSKPDRALEWAQTSVHGSIVPLTVDKIFKMWVTIDRAGAIQGLNMIDDVELRKRIESVIVDP